MPLPYYVSPEQMMKDKAEYARKGIARGRSIVTLEYQRGHPAGGREPLQPPAQGLRDLRPDRLRGVGKYNEFENLRIAGIRHADVKGYSYSRGDVDGQGAGQRLLPGAGQHLHPGHQALRGRGAGGRGGDDNGSKSEIYHILYDGTIEDEKNYAAMGGQAEEIRRFLKDHYQSGDEPGRRPAARGPRPDRSPRTRRSPSAT